MIEKDGKKTFWDWENPVRMNYIAHTPLTSEDISKKIILLIDMVYPKEYNKVTKRDEKIKKCQRLCFGLQ